MTRFKEGLNKLLDAFAQTKARIVLLAPPTRPTSNIELYAGAIQEVARGRGHLFVDLTPPAERRDDRALTENGIHLTAFGYQVTGALLARALCPDQSSPPLPRPDSKLTREAEVLRQAIIEKNQLYFHRYRPQNDTYLFGFRKHEQGNNAVEVPQFDALIEKKEKEIAKLRLPVKHTYEMLERK